jgi:hypothetical protein
MKYYKMSNDETNEKFDEETDEKLNEDNQLRGRIRKGWRRGGERVSGLSLPKDFQCGVLLWQHNCCKV